MQFIKRWRPFSKFLIFNRTVEELRKVLLTYNSGTGTFGSCLLGAAVWGLDIWAPGLSGGRFFFFFSFVRLFRFVARFARVRIEDSSLNRFVLNGIQGIACFIIFFFITRKIKKIGKRRPNVRRPYGTAPSCLAPNRQCPNGGA